MDTQNVNLKTGIRYGVIQGNSVPILMEKIFDNGTDESYARWRLDKIQAVKAALKELESDDSDSKLDRIALETFDAMEWGNSYNCDESDYSYEDRQGNQFLLGYLGGAPLIWCIKTSAIVRVKALCSPCVPNAGDLDSGIVDDENGYECYGLPENYAE